MRARGCAQRRRRRGGGCDHGNWASEPSIPTLPPQSLSAFPTSLAILPARGSRHRSRRFPVALWGSRDAATVGIGHRNHQSLPFRSNPNPQFLPVGYPPRHGLLPSFPPLSSRFWGVGKCYKCGKTPHSSSRPSCCSIDIRPLARSPLAPHSLSTFIHSP